MPLAIAKAVWQGWREMRLPAALFLLSVLPVISARAAVHEDGIKGFVSEHCMDCHDNATKKAGFSVESLADAVTSVNAGDWLKMLEQIERRNMPPADEDQPSAEERRAAIMELEGKLVANARTLPRRKPAVLRRLNRTEYRQTIRDLLGLDVSSFDPTREFPDEARAHGFASNGEKLVTSSFLLRQYLEAAEQIVGRAVHFEPKPEVRRWELLPPFDRTTGGSISGESSYYRKIVKQAQPYQSIGERTRDMPKMGYHPLDELRAGMPVGGWYTIRIQAEAKFRYANLDPKKFRFPSMWDSEQPLRLELSTASLTEIDPDNKEALNYAATHLQAGQRTLAVWDLPDDQPVWLECTVWLDGGEFPRLGFPNGPSDSNNRLYQYFLDNKEALLTKEQLEIFEQDQKSGGGNANVYMWFESPRIRVSKIEVEGPKNDTWPPESHRLIFGSEPYRSEAAGDVLQKFATRAWRRPASASEVAPLVNLVRAVEAKGKTPEMAIQEGLKGVLCSPEFLYREEKADTLGSYEIASRLSYFLWSSMPDEELLKLAATGELNRPEARRRQAARMLEDARSEGFVEEFLDGWLGLRKLGAMAPDVRKFPGYYDYDLEPMMKTETRLFFRQLLHVNGSIDRFLDSDYAFINRELAQLYGIDPKLVEAGQGKPVEGLRLEDLVPDAYGRAPSLAFARVKLPDPRRGGLLGQASVLTLTANGVDTSPVLRGVWILDNILGAPPSPPPPNVPTIEPDIRGAKTIRDQMQKHREAASCRACHHYIDPPGFALENFDPIGRWRGHYITEKTHLPVDASGKFGADKFADVTGFKPALLARHDQFARCLVEKLLVDALGRELDVVDRPQIREIVEAAEREGYGLRDLILLCVENDLFGRK